MSSPSQKSRKIRFAEFELDLETAELRRNGSKAILPGQPFQILVMLLSRPGQLVTREELKKQLWPSDTFVDFDVSLNKAVNRLREALGDSAEHPRFVETLPRKGYRFVGAVGNGTGTDLRDSVNPLPAACPRYRFIAPVTGDDGKAPVTVGYAVSHQRAWKITVSLVIVVVAAVATGRMFWRACQAQPLTEKDTIVLADFTNTTGDPVFDDTLKQGLRVQLEQSPFLNILSDEKVSEQLPLMGRQKEDRLTKDLARDLCQRLGYKAVLAGSISSLGTRYVIGLNAFNCHTGEGISTEQVEVDSREHVLNAVGQSATKIRQRLGESLPSIQKYETPLEQATTPSLEALQAYSLGQKAWLTKGVDDSFPFFQRAVELDPQFAMAYSRLGTAYSDVGEGVLSVENTRKGYELREKASQRERLYLESHYHHYATGDLEKAEQVYEFWQQIYPRDWVSYTQLVGVYTDLGKYEKALEQAREEMHLDQSNQIIYNDLAGSYLDLNRLAEAHAVLKQAEERKIESGELLGGRYRLALLRGDTREMERLRASAAEKPVAEYLLFLDTFQEAYHGRRKKVRELLRRKVEFAERIRATVRAASHQADAALMEAYFGDPQQARADAETALKVSAKRDSGVTSASALALALAGDTAQAEKLAAELSRKFPLNTQVQRCALPTIHAVVALHRGNAEKALELLPATMGPYELGATTLLDPMYIRGRAYLMLHDGGAAAGEFREVIDHPWHRIGNLVGALAHLGLARAYTLQGDTTKSRAAYQDFLTLWKEADPDIPILKQANAEYANLQ